MKYVTSGSPEKPSGSKLNLVQAPNDYNCWKCQDTGIIVDSVLQSSVFYSECYTDLHKK